MAEREYYKKLKIGMTKFDEGGESDIYFVYGVEEPTYYYSIEDVKNKGPLDNWLKIKFTHYGTGLGVFVKKNKVLMKFTEMVDVGMIPEIDYSDMLAIFV